MPATKRTPKSHKIPDWVTETPESESYGLTMWDGSGGPVQEIDMTRAEFLALKEHLATMRGYNASTASPATAATAENRPSAEEPKPAPARPGRQTQPEPNAAKIARAVLEMDSHDLALLSVAMAALDTHTGVYAPAETFLQQVLLRAAHRGPLTPDRVSDALEEFKENFEDARELTQRMARTYPEFLNKPAASAA